MDTSARQKEISRDIDSYISSKRKRNGLFGWFGKNEPVGEAQLETHPHVQPYDDATPAEEVAQQETPAEVESPDTQEPDVSEEDMADADDAQPKKGWFSRWFGSDEVEGEPALEEGAEASDPVDEDLREVARISLSFLRMTNPEALTAIKASPDFEKFKEILKRRQVIK